jgi:hypothetical protein
VSALRELDVVDEREHEGKSPSALLTSGRLRLEPAAGRHLDCERLRIRVQSHVDLVGGGALERIRDRLRSGEHDVEPVCRAETEGLGDPVDGLAELLRRPRPVDQRELDVSCTAWCQEILTGT